ncbi:MtrB/PioB family outer membrane beta-barrel protein [Robiginitomaculum antarcticum]|uniref:MtrB/PioB family outer membrane beta-barrel protein n=1 Tax=Robiginitomaculum antarcticum TaxID=437507 RepID=UPI00039B2514|nr:MtrB/PioB family outer membrane beta-barrel protein [Robiginitomaculum antarcticum]
MHRSGFSIYPLNILFGKFCRFTLGTMLCAAPIAANAQTSPAQPITSTIKPKPITPKAPPPKASFEEPPNAGFDIYDFPDEIVVVGVKQGGFTETSTVLPDIVFGIRDILAFGAGDIGELLDAIRAETFSNSDEPPLLLLNGRPVTSMKAIKRFPTEAVRRVEVLPPNTAVKFTSDPSRRVLNFILRSRFHAATGKATAKTTTEGGGTSGTAEFDTLKIKNRVRISLNAAYEKTENLKQAQRNIPARNIQNPFSLGGTITALNQSGEIDPTLSALGNQPITIARVPDAARLGPLELEDFLSGANESSDIDPQEFRDLKPQTESLTLGASLFKPIGERLSISGSIDAEFSTSESQRGLVGSQLILPPDNLFSPFEQSVSLHRYDGPIKRRNAKDDIETNIGIFGDYSDWRWSLEGRHSNVTNARTASRDNGVAGLQDRLYQNDSALNPFGPFPILINTRSNRSEETLLLKAGISGKVAAMPAGDVTGSVRFEYVDAVLNSVEIDSDRHLENMFSRKAAQASTEMSIPLTGNRGRPKAAGKLSWRLSGAVRGLDGFGTLTRYGTGLNWNASDKLRLEGSLDYQDRAPKLTQLGNPVIRDSNIRVTDFEAGRSVFIDRVSGGNPDLDSERRRTLKISAKYRMNKGFSFNTRYQARTTDNAISSFPFLTPQVAEAFPERLQRSETGTLISLDARPLNAHRTQQASVRSGFNWKKRFTKREGTKWPRDQISLSVYHTWRLEDKFQFLQDGPVFDLLHGAALRRQGGEPKHEISARINVRRKNYGGTLYGTYETGTRIDVGSLPGNQGRNGDLNINTLSKANLRVFYELGRKPNGRKVKRTDWRRDLRITLDVTNITNSKQSAVNGQGNIPFGYEEDALDPLGRAIMLSLRKVYFK